MKTKQSNPLISVLAPISMLLGTLLLTACATTFTSQVTTANHLPAVIAEKSFKIALTPETANTPEFQHASEDIKTRLQELGFNEAKEPSAAALTVAIDLTTIAGNAHVTSPFGTVSYLVTPSGMVIPMGTGMFSQPYYPFSFFHSRGLGSGLSPYSMYSRRLFNPWYSPYYFGRRLGPFFEPELNVRQNFEHRLAIKIMDSTKGTTLYEVTASTEQTEAEISEHLSLLVESALKDFPNKSGSVRMRFEFEK